ncbi:MAG: ABC transporter ATP-binding protein [Flavobacteriales bacterium]|nr:ABC transporter ATP-binding protein [Flavobacteriales bacterium]
MEPIIEITGLVKRYNQAELNAVDGITVEVRKGEIFGLLGPNGAGKTTLISILCGIVKPSEGQVRINGIELQSGLQDIKKIIGVVPQEIALYPSLTVKENLTFFGKLYDLKGLELQESIDIWLNKFGLIDKMNHRIETFSGGMKRRVNLIAGLLHKPQILFLDEPTVGIDVHSRAVITEHLKEINQNQGVTIIYTSHHMDEAEYLCTNISIIDSGIVIAGGSPKNLLKQNKDCNRLADIFLKLTGKSLRD